MKNRVISILHYQVPPRMIRKLCLIILAIISCFLFMVNAEAIAVVYGSLYNFLFGVSNMLKVGSLITVTIFFVIIFCLFDNLLISYIIMEGITICWGIANRIVLYIRDQFITINEFELFGEAIEVKIDMGIFYYPIIVESLVIGLINGFLIWLLIRKNKSCSDIEVKNKKKYLFVRLIVIIIMILCFIGIYSKKNQDVLDDIYAHRKVGCVVWFCQSLFGNTTETISDEEAQMIYNNFMDAVSVNENIDTEYPNIIVIMSEAFWDLNNLEGIVETNVNPMDKYFRLAEDAIIGQVAVNIYGGGTVISEFEFLTGLNVRYLNRLNCYGAYYSNEQESMATYLKSLGYYTMAMHPYDKEYYDRDMGYPNMGFDVFYSEAEFVNRDIYHGYISDMSLTKEIIERYEERKQLQPERPIFTFVVSVQNHVYNMHHFDEGIGKEGYSEISISSNNKNIEDEVVVNLEEYYNGMSISVEALEELINYYKRCEEDTVIVFYGDHAPSFVKQLYNTEEQAVEMNLYRTPYMIWTNYVNEYESYGDISLPYLSTVLIEYLDLPKPNQYYMNRYMLEHYPINTKFEQLRFDTLEEQKLIDMMSILSTIDKCFPKEEMALPFWEITK